MDRQSRSARCSSQPKFSPYDPFTRPLPQLRSGSFWQTSDRKRRSGRSASHSSASTFNSLTETALTDFCSTPQGIDDCAFTNLRRRGIALACGHRICRRCLEGKFRDLLSQNRSPFSPPRCCTSTAIPLEKVELLFSADDMRLLEAMYYVCNANECGRYQDGILHAPRWMEESR